MKSLTTSGIHKKYKPGQLVTINHRVFRIIKRSICMNDCLCCYYRDYERFDFCQSLPVELTIKLVLKHKG